MSTQSYSATQSPAAEANPVSISAGFESCSPPAASRPLSPGTKRARLHRKRRRQGLRAVRVLVHEKDIEAMVWLGYLKEEERDDPEALGMAVYCAVDMALDEAKYSIARDRAHSNVTRNYRGTRPAVTRHR